MKKNPFISDKNLFGSELYLKRVLCEYGYPRVFICEIESKDVFYLFFEIEAMYQHTKWLVTKITKNQMNDLIKKRLSVNSIYLNSDDVCTVKTEYAHKTWSVESEVTFDYIRLFTDKSDIYAE